MIQRILILDTILIAILAVGSNRIYRDWMEFESSHKAELVQAGAEPFAASPVPPPPAPPSATTDWTDVSSRNLFSFDRSDITLTALEEPKVQAGPKPILFGTMTIGSEHVAMLAMGQSGNRNSRPMHIGETIDGWKLLEIEDKSVVVGANETRETVVINDPTAKVPREQRRTAGNSGAAPAVSTVGSRPASPPPVAAPAPARNPANPATTQGNTGRRVIRTPFGDIIDNEQ